jgi:outer membrane protein assembly factor BamB
MMRIKRLWLAILLCPPLGLAVLWLSRPGRVWVRLLASVGILFYGLIYVGLVLGALVLLTPLDLEWEGGFPPVLTFRKTTPDYTAVERHRTATATQAVSAVGTAPAKARDTWPGFRGPNRDGHYTALPIRTNWPAEGLRPRWRQPIGGGYGSFAIAEGRAYTIEQRREQEAVTAYDVETGRELWAHLYPAFFTEWMGGDGPRSTPEYDEGRVYALGATGEFHCLDAATGRVIWHKNILTENGAENLHWAQSASPLIIGEKLILVPGGPNGRSVVAYHKGTGAVLWATRSEAAAYSSPLLVELAGRLQLLVAVENRVLGLKVEDGATLWEFPWVVQQNNRNIAQPVVVSSNRFVLSAGYGTGCAAVDITHSSDDFAAREAWRNRNLKNKFASSVLWEGHLYGLDEDILTCLDAETGARKWKDGRYDYGQVLLASGHLVILCGNGDLALVQATPAQHRQAARFPLFNGKTWNVPAMAGGRLLVRNAVEMACFDLSLP